MNTTGKSFPQEISHATKKLRFKTDKGHCYVLGDKIVITNDRNITLEKAWNITRWHYIKIGVFLLTAVLSVVYSLMELGKNQLIVSGLYLVFAFSFAFLAKSQIKSSLVTVIYKDDIISADFYGARLGRKNAFFNIVHSNDSIVKHTPVTLPKSKESGRSNTQKALELMHELMD